nr:Chain A, Clathrin light chain A [Homo sapiens]
GPLGSPEFIENDEAFAILDGGAPG